MIQLTVNPYTPNVLTWANGVNSYYHDLHFLFTECLIKLWRKNGGKTPNTPKIGMGSTYPLIVKGRKVHLAKMG